MPASIPPGWVTDWEGIDAAYGSCFAGTSDGNGVLALGTPSGPNLNFQDYETDTWFQYAASGARTSAAALEVRDAEVLFGQPSGFQVVWQKRCINTFGDCTDSTLLSTWSAGSGAASATPVFSPFQAPDPGGGMVLGGLDRSGALLVQRFDQRGAALSAPARVTAGPVGPFAMGASRRGPTLAVWDDKARGGGTLRGRWVSASGRWLTGSFKIATGVPDALGLELVPLLDGTLALRTSTRALTASPPRFLGRFAPGSAVKTAVPAWLATRPSARVFFVRGAHAYALLFPIDASEGCGVQHVALFSGSGTRCGGFDVGLGGASNCVGHANIGRDGTLFVSGKHPPVATEFGCRQRVLPGLLR